MKEIIITKSTTTSKGTLTASFSADPPKMETLKLIAWSLIQNKTPPLRSFHSTKGS